MATIRLKKTSGRISALEAMAAGTPIIAWDNYTYTQILKHDYSAYLVKSWDSISLGEGIAYLLNNGDFSHLRINAQKEAKKYDSEALSNRFHKIIQQLYEPN